MPRDVYAETAFGLPPGPMPMATCACGAIYRDNESGWDEHDVVFGHRPVNKQSPPVPEDGGLLSARADEADPYDDHATPQTGGGDESHPATTAYGERTTSGSDARASESPPPQHTTEEIIARHEEYAQRFMDFDPDEARVIDLELEEGDDE